MDNVIFLQGTLREFFELGVIYMILYCVFLEELRFRSIWKGLLLLIIPSILVGALRGMGEVFGSLIVDLITAIWLAIFLIKGKISRKILAFSVGYFGASSIFQINITTLGIILGVEPQTVRTYDMINLVWAILAFLLTSAFAWLRSKHSFGKMPGYHLMILSLICLFCSILFGYMIGGGGHLELFTQYMMLFVQVSFLSLGIGFVLVDYARVRYRRENGLKEQYVDVCRSYYEEIRRNNREARMLRHDMRHHLAVMECLCQQKRYEELEHYIEGAGETVDRGMGTIPNVGDEVLNAVLFQNIREAEKKQIKVSYTGFVQERMPITSFDLCAIVSNLLSNAIEYGERCGIEKVSFYIGMFRDNLVIRVVNPVKEQIDPKKLYGITSKKNRNRHGLGLDSVRETVEKYQGTLQLECKNMQFSATVLIASNGGKMKETLL